MSSIKWEVGYRGGSGCSYYQGRKRSLWGNLRSFFWIPFTRILLLTSSSCFTALAFKYTFLSRSSNCSSAFLFVPWSTLYDPFHHQWFVHPYSLLFVEECKLLSYSFRCVHPPVISCPSGLNIFLSALFHNTFSLCYPLIFETRFRTHTKQQTKM